MNSLRMQRTRLDRALVALCEERVRLTARLRAEGGAAGAAPTHVEDLLARAEGRLDRDRLVALFELLDGAAREGEGPAGEGGAR